MLDKINQMSEYVEELFKRESSANITPKYSHLSYDDLCDEIINLSELIKKGENLVATTIITTDEVKTFIKDSQKKRLDDLINRLKDNKELELNLHIEMASNISPFEVNEALKDLGWNKKSFDQAGWQGDTWIKYNHPNYLFELVLFYCGYTFEILLYRSDIYD